MCRRAIHLRDPLDTKLHPACRAVWAHPASAIVVLHDAHADTRLPFGHAGTDRNDDAAWLMPGDHRPGAHFEAKCRGAAGRPVELEVAAAHPGSLDFEHDLARPGARDPEIRRTPRGGRRREPLPSSPPPLMHRGHRRAHGLCPSRPRSSPEAYTARRRRTKRGNDGCGRLDRWTGLASTTESYATSVG